MPKSSRFRKSELQSSEDFVPCSEFRSGGTNVCPNTNDVGRPRSVQQRFVEPDRGLRITMPGSPSQTRSVASESRIHACRSFISVMYTISIFGSVLCLASVVSPVVLNPLSPGRNQIAIWFPNDNFRRLPCPSATMSVGFGVPWKIKMRAPADFLIDGQMRFSGQCGTQDLRKLAHHPSGQ